MRPVGYLLHTEKGLAGEPGRFYDYILAGNGLFLRAANPWLRATVCLATAPVRGLLPLEAGVALTQGRIPQALYDLALGVLAADPGRERYLAVTWEGGYHLRMPPQAGSAGGVTYQRLTGTVLELHSHGPLGACFSLTDDQDEQGLRLSLVVGRLESLLPQVRLRVGAYGCFAPVRLEEVFG